MKGTGWPLPCACPNLPVKWPVKFICTVTYSPATIILSTVTLRSGTAARKRREAKAGPSGPCGRPGGSV